MLTTEQKGLERQAVFATSFGDVRYRSGNGGTGPARIGFLFIGGAHHMLHLAPVAVELARKRTAAVHLFVGCAEDAAALDRVLARLGAKMPITVLPTPGWARMLPAIRPSWSALKLPRILSGARMLAEMDVLVTAERTSTILKRLPGRCPALVHIPHGAGDRAQGFEPRIALFDHVIVAGEKDRERMTAAGLVAPENCSVSGYVKLAAILAADERSGGRPQLFDNRLPTILYNPHFASQLSSWHKFSERLVADVVADGGFNLIIAPHVRLRARLSDAERATLRDLGGQERVLVDLGSERSTDMTYTLAADIYVGDVSSQVYEFVHRPRPCVFLNATGADHAGDPDFTFWNFGEVVADPAAMLPAIHRAAELHGKFGPIQEVAVRRAFGPPGANAPGNAAATIAAIVRQRRQAMQGVQA